MTNPTDSAISRTQSDASCGVVLALMLSAGSLVGGIAATQVRAALKRRAGRTI